MIDVKVPSYYPRTVEDYRLLSRRLHDLYKSDRVTWAHRLRVLGMYDLYFLMREILSTRLWTHPENKARRLFDCEWYLWVCRVAQFCPTNTLNILPRDHGKSTVGSFGSPIRIALEQPNDTQGLFAVTEKISTPMLELVKVELETNELAHELYPDRLWLPGEQREGRWSTGEGITVKRRLPRKDATLQALGLKSVSTSKRMKFVHLDDVATPETVESEDVTKSTNNRLDLMANLGMPGTRRVAWGTFQKSGDSYHHMIEERGWRLNHVACWQVDKIKSRYRKRTMIPVDLVVDRQKPYHYSTEYLEGQETIMGPATFAIQMLGAPATYALSEFKIDWMKFYKSSPFEIRPGSNVAMIVDPAARRGTNKHSRTAIGVIAKRGNRGYYVLDGVLDRLNLAQRTDAVFELHRRWNPQFVYYEETGLCADREHMEYVMEIEGYHFPIFPVSAGPANLSKEQRVEKLIPVFRDGRWFWPEKGIPYQMHETGQMIDVVEWVIDRELLPFPNVEHIDFSDMMAKVMDRQCKIPWPEEDKDAKHEDWRRKFYDTDERDYATDDDWMGVN